MYILCNKTSCEYNLMLDITFDVGRTEFDMYQYNIGR